MEKGAAFFDCDNLSVVLQRENLQIDHLALAECLLSGRNLSRVFCYVKRESISNYGGDELLDFLVMNGCPIRVYPTRINNNSGDSSIQLVMDAVHYALSMRPDIVVIVTGDRNYAPLVGWIRGRGPRIEVLCIPGPISRQFKQVADRVIDVNKFLEPVY